MKKLISILSVILLLVAFSIPCASDEVQNMNQEQNQVQTGEQEQNQDPVQNQRQTQEQIKMQNHGQALDSSHEKDESG